AVPSPGRSQAGARDRGVGAGDGHRPARSSRDELMDERYELDRGAVEVIRRLEAYADARLDPSVAATTRMRAAVMAAAHRQAALIAADGAGALALAPAEIAPDRVPREG